MFTMMWRKLGSLLMTDMNVKCTDTFKGKLVRSIKILNMFLETKKDIKGGALLCCVYQQKIENLHTQYQNDQVVEHVIWNICHSYKL